MSFAVEIDWAPVTRAVAGMAAGIESGSARVAAQVAADTATAIRDRVPVRTGRLAATVGTVPTPDGAAVTYGGGLPYARYIEHRTGAVADGAAGAAERFDRAQTDMARTEVRKL